MPGLHVYLWMYANKLQRGVDQKSQVVSPKTVSPDSLSQAIAIRLEAIAIRSEAGPSL